VNLPDRVSYAEFLAYAESHDGKCEFVGGQIVAQARPTKRHQRLASALLIELAAHVRARGCDVLPDAALALRDDSQDERAPDLLVTCDPEDLADEEPRIVRCPCVVIEILSPSTAYVDLKEKLRDYKAIGSVREYLICDSQSRWVRLYRYDNGVFVANDFIGGIVYLASLDFNLDIDALYERARIASAT
jgi:Uma2 family endonuclease